LEAFFPDCDFNSDLTWKEGILTFRVHTDMTMSTKLARLPPRHGKTKRQSRCRDVAPVTSTGFSPVTPFAAPPFQIIAELPFKQIINALDALFFA